MVSSKDYPILRPPLGFRVNAMLMRGDRIKFVKAGIHQELLHLLFLVVFLVKGPIYLVCISCTEEPFESLKAQLELIYGQEPSYICSCIHLSSPCLCNKTSCWCYIARCC